MRGLDTVARQVCGDQNAEGHDHRSARRAEQARDEGHSGNRHGRRKHAIGGQEGVADGVAGNQEAEDHREGHPARPDHRGRSVR